MMRDRDSDYSHSKPATVMVPEEPLVSEFVDNTYWKVE